MVGFFFNKSFDVVVVGLDWLTGQRLCIWAFASGLEDKFELSFLFFYFLHS